MLRIGKHAIDLRQVVEVWFNEEEETAQVWYRNYHTSLDGGQVYYFETDKEDEIRALQAWASLVCLDLLDVLESVLRENSEGIEVDADDEMSWPEV
jgi:hypothetical protein